MECLSGLLPRKVSGPSHYEPSFCRYKIASIIGCCSLIIAALRAVAHFRWNASEVNTKHAKASSPFFLDGCGHVLLQVMAIWDHVHVPERRLAVPMGGDMRGWRSKEVGRFVVPQHGDARTIRLEFNLDGKNLSGGFPGLSGSVTSPGTRDKFRRLVTRGLAKVPSLPPKMENCRFAS
jgi:hypothetical protein